MTGNRRFLPLACAAVSLSTLAGAQASAQGNGSTGDGFEEDAEDIVVTGQRERGSVAGDIKPEEQLRPADIRALGVASISELLSELGPQLQSASGKPPVTLLEGHRIASFREIANIPAEAIARVDILPEEVSLRYGYSADQKVMNIVLRQRFRAFTGELTGRLPTAGDGATQELDGGFLAIRNGHRVNISSEYTITGRIFETDRDLTDPESPARTLSPMREELTVDGSYARPIGERTQATLSGEIGSTQSASNIGLTLPGVTIAGGTPYAGGPDDRTIYPSAPGIPLSLERSSSTQTGQIGLTVNAERSTGQWTLTATYNRQDSRGITARPFNLTAYREALEAGDPDVDPALPVPPAYLIARPGDETQSRSDTANVDLLYNRSLFRLPAGQVNATVKLGGSLLRLESSQERDLTVTSRRLGRDSGSGSLSLDFPLLPASSPVGRLSANANAAVEHHSDAGTLRNFGFGLNWTPRKGMSVSAAYRDQESAPTPSQLGDPVVYTPFVPIFDYVRGESVLVTTISGGNPGLADARTSNFRLGLNMNLLQDPNIGLTIDYNRRRSSGAIMNFPGVTADTAAAFPGRFVRDADGQLTQVDLRPINITEQKRDSLRWGINFSKRLKTPQSQIQAMREAFQRRFPNGVPGRRGEGGQAQGDGQAAPGGEGQTPQGQQGRPGSGEEPRFGERAGGQQSGPGAGAGEARGPGGGGRGFGGRGFGGGGGGAGGRINFAIYHEWTFTNTTQLAPNLPVLDLLDGDSLGSGAGPSRHNIQVQAGISQSGYGLRLTGEWDSATRIRGVAGVPTSQLHFSDLGKFNLRLFANLSQQPKLVEAVPFLRGVRVQLGVDNIFDARQKVTDGAGNVPFAYQPAFIDPVGRTVRVSIRKLLF